MHVTGSCHCGAVRFDAEIDSSKVVVCHCMDCQVLTGSAFRVFVPAPASRFRIAGPTTSYVKTAESGLRRRQAFCPTCGTPIYSSLEDDGSSVMLRVGTLDERATLIPSLQIWRRSALSWVDNLAPVANCDRQERL